MTGNSVVSATKLLRDKASTAFRAGDGELGHAYKGISQALENQLDRAVQNTALGQPSDIVSKLRASRQLYAKASLIQDSMSPDGTVLGPKLAAAWRKDEPITGPLRDAAEFAAQLPKANISSSASGSPISHMGGMGSLIAAALMEGATKGEHGMLPMVAGAVAYPAARMGARKYLLSGLGQEGAIPKLATRQASRKMSPQALAAALSASPLGANAGGPPQ
jgi:hypothetical protein